MLFCYAKDIKITDRVAIELTIKGVIVTKSYLVIAALLASATAPASAATLTFEGFSNSIYTAPIVRSGFSIGNVGEDEQHFHEIDSTAFPGFVVNNGTGVLFNDRNTRLFIESATPGQAFTFSSFDGAAAGSGDATGGATTLNVRGFLLGNLVTSANFTINGNNFASFSGFAGNFDRLVFDAVNGGGGFSLDNVTLNGAAVPEPASWAMMIGGFGLLGAAMRRRTAAKVSFA